MSAHSAECAAKREVKVEAWLSFPFVVCSSGSASLMSSRKVALERKGDVPRFPRTLSQKRVVKPRALAAQEKKMLQEREGGSCTHL